MGGLFWERLFWKREIKCGFGRCTDDLLYCTKSLFDLGWMTADDEDDEDD